MEKKAPASSALVEVEQARAVQEVQGAIIVARKFPRDRAKAVERILEECKRPVLAEAAIYAYPRGDTTVTGPSIRLAECIAQNWQNLQHGVRELSRTANESTAQAYAWDVENNVRAEKTFQVPHIRYTKAGSYRLTDPRDIYEMVANQGARRLRACILSIVPGDVVDAAVAACAKTQDTTSGDTFPERLKKMTVAFAEIGVTVKDLETKLHKKLEAFTPADLKSMGRVLLTIQDGMAKKEDYFGPKGPQASGAQAAREAAARAAPKGVKGPGAVARMFGAKPPAESSEPVMSPEDEAGAGEGFELHGDEPPQREPGDD
jgi:hypothetical protein